MDAVKVEAIARVWYEVGREKVVREQGKLVAPVWEDFRYEHADEAEEVCDRVRKVLEGGTPEECHDLWCERRLAEGWVYGPELSLFAMTDPRLLPYERLSVEEQRKDALFRATVTAMSEEGCVPSVAAV